MKSKGISLSQLILNVSNELREAEKYSHKEKSVMEFTECELELHVNISVDGKAGLKFWVVGIGGEIQKNKSHTIKVKFKSWEENRLLLCEESP